MSQLKFEYESLLRCFKRCELCQAALNFHSTLHRGSFSRVSCSMRNRDRTESVACARRSLGCALVLRRACDMTIDAAAGSAEYSFLVSHVPAALAGQSSKEW